MSQMKIVTLFTNDGVFYVVEDAKDNMVKSPTGDYYKVVDQYFNCGGTSPINIIERRSGS